MQADACLLPILDREHRCGIKDAQDSTQGRGIGKHETSAPNVSQSCANCPDSRAAPTARKQTDIERDLNNEYELLRSLELHVKFIVTFLVLYRSQSIDL